MLDQRVKPISVAFENIRPVLNSKTSGAAVKSNTDQQGGGASAAPRQTAIYSRAESQLALYNQKPQAKPIVDSLRRAASQLSARS